MAETLKPKSFKPEDESSASPPPNLSKSKKPRSDSAIPKEVANRMARRIAVTTGLPTFSGMAVFIVSYLLISRGIADVPPALTLIVSALCFLIGLVGMSYGILSASWEATPGSLLGLENIRPNIGRAKDAFNALKEQSN